MTREDLTKKVIAPFFTFLFLFLVANKAKAQEQVPNIRFQSVENNQVDITMVVTNKDFAILIDPRDEDAFILTGKTQVVGEKLILTMDEYRNKEDGEIVPVNQYINESEGRVKILTERKFQFSNDVTELTIWRTQCPRVTRSS